MKKRILNKIFAVAIGFQLYGCNNSNPIKEKFIDENILSEYGLDGLEAPQQSHELSWDKEYVCKIPDSKYFVTYVSKTFTFLNEKEEIYDTYFLANRNCRKENDQRIVHFYYLYHSDDLYDYHHSKIDSSFPNMSTFEFYYTLKGDNSHFYKLEISLKKYSFGNFAQDYGWENTMYIDINKYPYYDVFMNTDMYSCTFYDYYIILFDSDIEKIKITNDNFKDYFDFEYNIFDYEKYGKVKFKIQSNNNYSNATFKIKASFDQQIIEDTIRLNGRYVSGEFSFEIFDIPFNYQNANVNISLEKEGYLYTLKTLQDYINIE